MGAFFAELMHVGVYKRSQGRITRQVTFAAMALAIALGLLRLSSLLNASAAVASLVTSGKGQPLLTGVMRGFHLWFPAVLLAAFVWIAYRLVNLPAFADFLIAVEAEINKVSWPTRTELFRASMVVLIVIFALGIYLAGCDIFWRVLLSWGLGIL